MFSPRFGVIYKPADNMSLYVSYSESFLPRSGEQYKKLDASGAALDPDVLKILKSVINMTSTML